MKTRTQKLLEKREIQLQRAENEIDRLHLNIQKQSIILNKIRETLLTKSDWNGTFEKGKDLSDVIQQFMVRRGETCQPLEKSSKIFP